MYSKLIRSKLEFVANPSQSTIKPLQIDNTIETEVSDEYQYHLQQNKPLFADCSKSILFSFLALESMIHLQKQCH